jgi:hypothetical protein
MPDSVLFKTIIVGENKNRQTRQVLVKLTCDFAAQTIRVPLKVSLKVNLKLRCGINYQEHIFIKDTGAL